MKKVQGLTLIELILTLAIIATLTGWALPNFRQFKLNHDMTQEINRLSATINFARNQSIILSQQIILCPSSTLTACDGGNNWHGGWIVFADHDFDRQFNGHDTMLLNEQKMVGGLTAQSSAYRKIIRYDPTGFAPGSNLTIRYCDERGAAHGKAIIISNVGRPRIAKTVGRCS